jgi:hypothetical protein
MHTIEHGEHASLTSDSPNNLQHAPYVDMKSELFVSFVTVAASHTMITTSDGGLNFSLIVATSSGILTSDMLLQSTDDTNATNMPCAPADGANESQAMQYIIIPLGILILLGLLSVMVIRFMICS